MRKQMDAQVIFMMPSWAKKKLWRLCRERGLLPSQVIREAVLEAMARLEREGANWGSTEEGGGQRDS